MAGLRFECNRFGMSVANRMQLELRVYNTILEEVVSTVSNLHPAQGAILSVLVQHYSSGMTGLPKLLEQKEREKKAIEIQKEEALKLNEDLQFEL